MFYLIITGRSMGVWPNTAERNRERYIYNFVLLSCAFLCEFLTSFPSLCLYLIITEICKFTTEQYTVENSL